ncbi:MAG: hypothetical protein MUC63_04015 [Planctomycetes bacterium]|jgi:hypothetical protein|nr:hypothetical protein [Planctomycetota bacterium]
MERSRWSVSLYALGAVAAAVALAVALAVPLVAQEGPARPASAPDPVLGYLGLVGDKESTQSFLRGLEGRKEQREAGARRLSLFLPDLEQIYLYGNKAGVVAFAKGLPEGSTVRVLVRDAERLRNFGDRASTMTFLEALASRRCTVDLWIPDLPGLAKNGQTAAALRFLEALPPGSSVSIFAKAKEIYLHGDSAGTLGFLSAIPCRVEVRIDDPLLDVYLR